MQFLLSTIADIEYTWDESTKEYQINYSHKTLPLAQKYSFGLELAEFCISENFEKMSNILEHFKKNAQGSKLLTFHAPYNELFPQAVEPKLVDICNERFDFCYKLCEEFKVKKMVVHANYVKTIYFREWYVAKQVSFWKEFLKNHPGQCQIVIENTMENDPSVILDVIKGVNDDKFKMCLDIGHANLHEIYSIEEWIDMCAEYISHLHIHNNIGPCGATNGSTGDFHNPLNEGIIDYETILKEIEQKAGKDLTATIENYKLEESPKWLKEKGFI